MGKQNDELTRATEVFARGFCFTHSLTHPYLAERIGSVWAVRDAPRTRGTYRREEYIAHAIPAKALDQIARERARDRFAICAICASGESDESLRADFKHLHYRLNNTEPVMTHQLKRIPRAKAPADIVRVLTLT